jgi:hypothetical protein
MQVFSRNVQEICAPWCRFACFLPSEPIKSFILSNVSRCEVRACFGSALIHPFSLTSIREERMQVGGIGIHLERFSAYAGAYMGSNAMACSKYLIPYPYPLSRISDSNRNGP